MHFTDISSRSIAYLFIFFQRAEMVFREQILIILMKSSLSVFFLMDQIFSFLLVAYIFNPRTRRSSFFLQVLQF